jgi:hypothetical protein
VYALSDGQQLSVQLGQSLIPEPVAVQAAASGARAELAAAGRIAAGAGYPRLVLDVLRVDELSRGIFAQQGQPSAGAMSIGVVLRGRVFTADNQDAAIDTGDVRRAVQLTGNSDARADSTARDVALRGAAERAGRAAARIALGLPEPADETP